MNGRECGCGCGGVTQGGTFLPGHDAKLRARIEEKVGGLLMLEQLVETCENFHMGEATIDDVTSVIGSAFVDSEFCEDNPD